MGEYEKGREGELVYTEVGFFLGGRATDGRPYGSSFFVWGGRIWNPPVIKNLILRNGGSNPRALRKGKRLFAMFAQTKRLPCVKGAGATAPEGL